MSAAGDVKTLDALTDRWYASLAAGFPDLSVYAGDDYLGEAERCWRRYSSKYIRMAATILPRNLGSVVDLGCGIGKTTRALADLFPSARVVGTNVEGSRQAQVARAGGLAVVSGVDEIEGPVDLVFASDYFEHIRRPIEHLDAIVGRLRPRFFVIANSFNTRATGHFLVYGDGEEEIDRSGISRRFNARLRACGYEKKRTGFWNDRPAVWVKP